MWPRGLKWPPALVQPARFGSGHPGGKPAQTLGVVAKLVDVEAVRAWLEARDLALHGDGSVSLAVDNLGRVRAGGKRRRRRTSCLKIMVPLTASPERTVIPWMNDICARLRGVHHRHADGPLAQTRAKSWFGRTNTPTHTPVT